MRSAKGFRGIFAAAPATFRSSKPWRKRQGAGLPREIQSQRTTNWLRRPACRLRCLCWRAEPGAWLPIAGGTDLMVQYAARKLPARKLVSIWNLPELRRIEVSPEEICIGAGCTYTDLREHDVVGREFSLLPRAASWTGGIANQNRGTLGGNIVNASPAADSLPALLVYDAELLLVSVRGERRMTYCEFHTGYKKMRLATDELIRAICLPRQFFAEYVSYSRKVGARNAQAISKVCLAGLGRIAGGVIEDVRIAIGSVAPVPLRRWETERVATGKPITSSLPVAERDRGGGNQAD